MPRARIELPPIYGGFKLSFAPSVSLGERLNLAALIYAINANAFGWASGLFDIEWSDGHGSKTNRAAFILLKR